MEEKYVITLTLLADLSFGEDIPSITLSLGESTNKELVEKLVFSFNLLASPTINNAFNSGFRLNHLSLANNEIVLNPLYQSILEQWKVNNGNNKIVFKIGEKIFKAKDFISTLQNRIGSKKVVNFLANKDSFQIEKEIIEINSEEVKQLEKEAREILNPQHEVEVTTFDNEVLTLEPQNLLYFLKAKNISIDFKDSVNFESLSYQEQIRRLEKYFKSIKEIQVFPLTQEERKSFEKSNMIGA